MDSTIQIGLGDNKRLLPVHRLHSRLGDEFCKSLLKCHLGTGCDYISKIGTKYSALQAQPDLYLRNFGESGMLDSEQIKNAEKYLVKVFSNTSNVDTFDELRVRVWKRTNSVLGLPPTSYSVRKGHIPRWWYLYKLCCDILAHSYDYVQPVDYGGDFLDGDLIANKHLNMVPDELCYNLFM